VPQTSFIQQTNDWWWWDQSWLLRGVGGLEVSLCVRKTPQLKENEAPWEKSCHDTKNLCMALIERMEDPMTSIIKNKCKTL